MNIAEFSIQKKVITMTVTLVLVFAGINSFRSLARLEDPEFTIKEAIITTPYPGASAQEVEEEVSNVIEMAIQELGQLKRVESTSSLMRRPRRTSASESAEAQSACRFVRVGT